MPAFLLRRTEPDANAPTEQGRKSPLPGGRKQNRLHSGYILAEQENRLISQNRLDGGWMALPWLMPAAFECPSLLAIRAAIAPLTHGFQIRLQGLIPKVWLAGSA